MGKFMKFLYSIMLIVLTLLGAILIALGLGNLYLIDRLIYYIGQQNFFYVILGIGITLIVFAIIILIVLIKHRNRGCCGQSSGCRACPATLRARSGKALRQETPAAGHSGRAGH